MKLRTALITGVLLAAGVAHAEPERKAPTTAEGWYEEGGTQYTLGNFDKAVEAFKNGFELETDDTKKPAYLYNIAQAYRQANDCKNSVFFYKRFLALKANEVAKPLAPERRAEVDGWIRDGEACMKQQDALRTKLPDATMKPGDEAKKPVVQPPPPHPVKPVVVARAGGEDEGGGDEDGGAVHALSPDTPRLVSVRFVAGGTHVSAGDLSFPLQATAALVGGYPISINDKLIIEPGLGFTFTPAPYDAMGGASTTGKMFGVFANGGARYEVAPKIGVRGDLGLGLLVFSGLEAGNPFTENGAGTSGALSMFHLRAAVSADYLITPNLAATVTPFAFGYSPAKAGFRDGISSITSIDFMVGVGYRM
jgi:hypothetical protein